MKQKLLLFIAIMVCLYSCDSTLHIEKRRYMKGFYVSGSKGNKKDIPTASSINKEKDTLRLPDQACYVDELFLNNTVPKNNTSTFQTKTQKPVYKPQTKKNVKVEPKSLAQKNTVDNHSISKTKKGKTNGTMFMLLFSGIFTGAFWWFSKYRYKKAQTLRKWAFRNKIKSIFSIVCIRLFTIVSSFWLGVKLFDLDVLLPEYSTPALLTILTTGLTIHLFKKKSLKDMLSIFRTKFSIFLLGLIGILLCINLGNKTANENKQGIYATQFIKTVIGNHSDSNQHTQVSSPQKQESGDAGTIALQVFLSLLTIALLIFLQILVIMWSCTLSCAGDEAGSVVVLIGGTALVAFIGFVCFYFISKINLSKETPSTQTL